MLYKKDSEEIFILIAWVKKIFSQYSKKFLEEYYKTIENSHR